MLKFIKRLCIDGIVLFMDICFILILRHPASTNTEKKSILCIRLDAIGDAILWLSSAQYLRNIYPRQEYEITLVCNLKCMEIFQATDYFDSIIGVDRVRFRLNFIYRYQMLRCIVKKKYEQILNFAFSREFLFGDSIVRASNSMKKICFDGDCSNIFQWEKMISNRWYTELIPSTNAQVFEILRNAEFIHYLGYSSFLPLPVKWKWFSNYSVKTANNSYFIVFPGAGYQYRRWPINRFADVAMKTQQKTGWNIVLAGDKTEIDIGEEFMECLLARKVKCINLMGQTTLIDLATVISKARLLIGNETSAIHLAESLMIPSVCILGGGHYGRFFPYKCKVGSNTRAISRKMQCFHCNWQCKYDSSSEGVRRCIEEIKVEDVWQEVLSLIAEQPSSGENSWNA